MPTRPRDLPGAGPRPRLLGRPPLDAWRADRAARRVLPGRVPDRPSSPTSSSSRIERPGRSRPAPAGSYQKLEHPASGYSIVGVARGRRDVRWQRRRHARVAITGVGEVAYRAKAVEAALAGHRRLRRARSPPPPRTRPTARPSTATSTPTATIERRWPWSTPAARSRPRSAASAVTAHARSRPACASSGSSLVGARPARLAGAILTRDLVVGGARWSKGRRLSDDDLQALAAADPGPPITVAHRRTRRAPRGRCGAPPGQGRSPGPASRSAARTRAGWTSSRRSPASSTSGSPSWSGSTGSTRSRCSRSSTARSSSAATSWRASRSRRTSSTPASSRPARGSPASAASRSCGSRRSSPGGSASSSRSRSGRRRASGSRRAVRAKVEGLGSAIIDIVYVEDDVDAVETAVGAVHARRRPADLVLTAGSAWTDPTDAFFVAIEALGGRVVRRGVPSHPGLDALAGADRADGDPGPADVRGVLEGDRRRPAAAAAAVAASRRQRRPSPSSATAGS